MKSKNMITYTIKKGVKSCLPTADRHQNDEEERLVLLNALGEKVSPLEILKASEPHRVRPPSLNIYVKRWVRPMW